MVPNCSSQIFDIKKQGLSIVKSKLSSLQIANINPVLFPITGLPVGFNAKKGYLKGFKM